MLKLVGKKTHETLEPSKDVQGQRGQRSLALVYFNDNEAQEAKLATTVKLSLEEIHTYADSQWLRFHVLYANTHKYEIPWEKCHMSANVKSPS